jgi:hypothetical protein
MITHAFEKKRKMTKRKVKIEMKKRKMKRKMKILK